ncbi:Uncharacterised protein [Acholeplasma oculi]|uniref:Uncharacterized protein n=1 Tax=Acholeplasma oculi TaxID=35623 RepID=A0A061A9K6_9MOLU|nr:hypothetical protein [Acholeplasma oculi]CDR30548.1 hypothetical protein Aocu_04750 [Acholeplasma oculi]SKC47205.1 hypothetical protein SAMN02745122_1277 [Acholeplasma oculi]SUT89224.1 Uncharacterised protein [Acholeplasma oculi]
MKSLTNKLVMSVLALVMTGVALSIGVYAWFTVNNTATIQAFEADVQTGEGFYVSLNGTDWKNTITTADLTTAVSSVTFVALTSEDGVALTNLDTTAAAVGGYIEFDLLFVGSNALTSIELTNILLSSTTSSWIPGVDVAGTRSAGAPNTAITEYASNAARVSFEDLFTASAVTVVEQASGALGDTLTTGANGNSLGMGTFAGNEAVLFYNAIMDDAILETEFDAAALVEPTLIPAGNGINAAVGTLYTNDTATSLTFNVPGSVTGVIGTNYKIGALTVRVWVEGWDQEAFNSILSGTLSVSFSFTGI